LEEVSITGSIPVREKRVVVDDVQTVTVTGEGVLPQSKARGEVGFRNLTSQEVTIPAGTVVSVGNVRFVTTQAAEVAAGVGKTALVPILAAEGGLAGNVEAEAINTIEGRLGLSLSVSNPEPLTGGRELPSLQASEEDRTRAKKLLMATLKEAAREKFLDESNADDLLFEETLEVAQILSEKYDPPLGAAGTRLTVSMQVEFAARYASASDLTELATLALNASLPSGFRTASDAVTVTPLSNPFPTEDGSLRWNIRAERKITQVFDPVFVTQLVQGLGVNRAQANLNEILPPESEPLLRLSPSWWRWVPLLPIRIEVVTGP
jgi:hypothetical protein